MVSEVVARVGSSNGCAGCAQYYVVRSYNIRQNIRCEVLRVHVHQQLRHVS